MLRRAVLSIFGVLTILACSWALLTPKFFRVHDFIHAARIAELVRSAQDGHLPVRWSQNFDYGYGMPLFEFYAPLPYYVGGLFYWLGVDVVTSIKLLYILSGVLSWVGVYLLVSRISGRVAGTVAATLYTLNPYRAVNLFVRGALSEAWGMSWLPWVVLGLWMMWRKERWGWLVLALAIFGLALSHNLSLLMFLPLVLIWEVVNLAAQLWQARSSSKNLTEVVVRHLQAAGAAVLGLLLASFYIIPALLEKGETKVEQILGGYFYYAQHFLYIRQLITPFWGYGGSGWGPDDGLSFFLGTASLLGLVIVMLTIAVLVWRLVQYRGVRVVSSSQRQQLGMIFLALALMSISLLMTLDKSHLLWEKLTVLQTIQFPWRWLGPAQFWLAVAVGLAIGLARPKLWRLASGWLLVLLICLLQFWYFHPESYLDNADALYYTDPVRIQTEMSGLLPDYQPKQMAERLTPPTSLFLVPEGTEKDVEVLVNRTQQKLLKTNFLSPVKMDILIADFSGWEVSVSGQPVSKKPGQNGTIAIDVPAGEQQIAVQFQDTPVRQAADYASMIGFLLLLIGIFWSADAQRPTQKARYV